MQVFVGAGVGVDEELVEAEVRTAVRDELCHMIKELSGQQGCISVSHRCGRTLLLLLLVV